MYTTILLVTVGIVSLVVGSSRAVPEALAQPKANATTRQPVELFGVQLKRASRSVLRQAFAKAGMQATRVEDHYWVDLYNPKGLLDEATELAVGYVDATSEFAFAKYTFQSFMDTEQVQRIVKLVTTKYGAPARQTGHYHLGQVRVTWQLADGIHIEVARGWPDTTTTLTYLDPKAHERMQAEIDKEQDKTHERRAKAQQRAF